MYVGGVPRADRQENISLKSVQHGSKKSGSFGKRWAKPPAIRRKGLAEVSTEEGRGLVLELGQEVVSRLEDQGTLR